MFIRLGHNLCHASAVRQSLFRQHNRTIKRISHLKQKQNTDEIKDLQDISSNDHKYDIKEEERGISGFEKPEVVAEKPLLSLNITDKMKKMKKSGSLSIDMFVGKLDADFLIFPECLDNRNESALLYEQCKMVYQLWPKIWNDPEKLQQFNFNNMYELSVTEMMTIFDAIGSSSRRCYETDLSKPLPESTIFLNGSKDIEFTHIDVTKSILSLITRNCLTYYPLKKTSNVNLKNTLLPQASLDFQGRKHDRILPPIGFAYTERPLHFGSLPPQEWSTLGMDDDINGLWLIQGKKSRLPVDDNIENYLVFFRDETLAQKIGVKATGEEPNPSSDPLTGACIVSKDLIKSFSPVYHDSAGLKYHDIDLDLAISKDYEVFPAEKKSAWSLNIKGLGQLGASAVILGLLKDTLRRTYKCLADDKRGLLGCDLIQNRLTDATNKIFAIESMVYFVAGMYDGLDDGFDSHIEAAITKTLAVEYGSHILRNLQQICGSDMFLTSRLQEQINILDSFMDGCIHNRIYIGTLGVLWYARVNHVHLSKLRLAPWYPGYFTKITFKEAVESNDWLTLDADIKGNLHPRLEEAAKRLEFIIKRVKYSTEMICIRHGVETPARQTELARLAQMVIDSFMLIAVLSRSSRSFCNGTHNGELETVSANLLSAEAMRNVRHYISEIQSDPLQRSENVAEVINTINLRCGGYYPKPPVDVNI